MKIEDKRTRECKTDELTRGTVFKCCDAWYMCGYDIKEKINVIIELETGLIHSDCSSIGAPVFVDVPNSVTLVIEV